MQIAKLCSVIYKSVTNNSLSSMQITVHKHINDESINQTTGIPKVMWSLYKNKSNISGVQSNISIPITKLSLSFY